MSGKLAFVIEDDFDGSMVFAKALEINGLEPEQIMSGHLAVERLANSVPTLVVLDLHLPVVPGPEILKKIRADSRLTDTLVVVVTADPRMADLIRDDADLVLLKPTTFSQVRDLVGRLMAVRERNKAAAPEPAQAPAAAPALAEAPLPAAPEPPAPAPAAEPEKPAVAAPAAASPETTQPEPVSPVSQSSASSSSEKSSETPSETSTEKNAPAPEASTPAAPPAAKAHTSSKSKAQIKPA